MNRTIFEMAYPNDYVLRPLWETWKTDYARDVVDYDVFGVVQLMELVMSLLGAFIVVCSNFWYPYRLLSFDGLIELIAEVNNLDHVPVGVHTNLPYVQLVAN